MKNSKINKDSYLIDLVNQSYHYHKRVLLETESGVREYDYIRIRASRKIVSHIDNVTNDLSEKYKFIIENEVINNKKGSKWYMEYFSTPSYYRNRKRAYRLFLENIEK